MKLRIRRHSTTTSLKSSASALVLDLPSTAVASDLSPLPFQFILNSAFDKMIYVDQDLQLTSLGIKNMDTVDVINPFLNDENKEIIESHSPALSLEGQMIIKRIPDDNSCLFHALLFVLNLPSYNPNTLRQLIGALIASAPEHRFTSDFLEGRTREEYVKWLQKPTSWGGAVELQCMAEWSGVEIAAIDVVSGGKDMYLFNVQQDREIFINQQATIRDEERRELQSITTGKRVYLLYSGIHYDAVAFRKQNSSVVSKSTYPASSASSSLSLITMFDSDDKYFEAKAKALANQEHGHHQYTDMSAFTLKCIKCGVGLVGEKEAKEHASKTTHVDFVEF